MSLKKINLLIGITTASIFLSGVSAQAQTTKSLVQNKLIIAENVEKIEPSFDSTDVKVNYDFIAQLSAPQTDSTTQTAPLNGTVQRDSTPTTQPAPLNGTTPSDGTPTTPYNTTPPSDGTPTTPYNTTPPSDGTSTPPSTQTAPSDGTPTTPPTPYNTTPPSDGTSTPPSTQTAPPSDGNNSPFGGVNPGRATRSGSSYIGVGGNIGIGGDTGIGEGSFSVISKVGLTRNLSVRPSVLFGDNTTILLPVTLDFPARSLQITRYSVAPYIGGGAVISTGDNSDVGLLLTGGIDVPITTQFTATAGVNVGFVDETDVGIMLGVGYNFSGL